MSTNLQELKTIIERMTPFEVMTAIVKLSEQQTIAAIKECIEVTLRQRTEAENDYPNPKDIRTKIIVLARFDLVIIQMRQILQHKMENSEQN
jgi:hypothetical protein